MGSVKFIYFIYLDWMAKLYEVFYTGWTIIQGILKTNIKSGMYKIIKYCTVILKTRSYCYMYILYRC